MNGKRGDDTSPVRRRQEQTRDPFDRAEQALRTQGLSYPETTEAFPWGHRTLKVRGKAFVFMSREDGFSLSVKLPSSCHVALDLPFAEPTGYGLSRSGWVTARFAAGDRVPLKVLALWLEESYRAVAPKRLVARLDEASGGRGP